MEEEFKRALKIEELRRKTQRINRKYIEGISEEFVIFKTKWDKSFDPPIIKNGRRI